jgi:hypothetical protein
MNSFLCIGSSRESWRSSSRQRAVGRRVHDGIFEKYRAKSMSELSSRGKIPWKMALEVGASRVLLFSGPAAAFA